jgi:flavin-dependent dehydrogenase
MAVRSRFDAFCLDQTLAAGRNGGAVTLRKIDTILALRETDTHIELDIACLAEDGTQHTETLRAPVLIGADGSNGQTRRLANQLTRHSSSQLADHSALKKTGFSPSVNTSGLEGGFSPLLAEQENGALAPEGPPTDPAWYERGFALEATVPFSALHQKRSPSAQDHDLIFDFAPLPGGYGWLFPKGDHINIGVGAFAPEPTADLGAPSSTTASSSSKVGSHDAQLKAVTRQLLLDYTHQKLGLSTLDQSGLHISGQYLGMGGHAYIPRGRVLLTGDAAGLVDPLTGEGIHSAIVSGQAAAAAILSCADGERRNVAAAYARHLRPLQQTLAFSHRAAQAFYKQPERGFKAMRIPILRNLILKTYADGIPHTRLLTALAKLV